MSPLRLSLLKRLQYLLAACFYFGLGGFGLRAFWRLGLGESWRTAALTILGMHLCVILLVPGLWCLRHVVTGEPDGPQF